jgi:hypothetical protein
VEFTASKTVSVVPDTWLVRDGKCAWPSYKKQQSIDAAVQERRNPGDDWTTYDVRVLGSAGIQSCFVIHFTKLLETVH